MKKIILFAVAALALTACDNNSEDNPVETSKVALSISATIDDNTTSRAVGTDWHEGDRIGLTATVGETFHPHNNVKYTKKEGENKFEGDTLFFYNNMILSGYYPYDENVGKGNQWAIETSITADKQTPEEQAKFDFLYARKSGIKVAEAENVELNFAHTMSQLTFTFLNATKEVNVSNMVYYSLDGLVMTGKFNTLTGECVANPAEPDDRLETISIDVKGKVKHGEPLASIIVFPQIPQTKMIRPTNPDESFDPDKIEYKARLNMYMDEAQNGNPDTYQHYYCTLSFGDDMLKPGYHYNFKIYVTKVGLIMGEMTIVPWGEVENSLAATIDGNVDLPEE